MGCGGTPNVRDTRKSSMSGTKQNAAPPRGSSRKRIEADIDETIAVSSWFVEVRHFLVRHRKARQTASAKLAFLSRWTGATEIPVRSFSTSLSLLLRRQRPHADVDLKRRVLVRYATHHPCRRPSPGPIRQSACRSGRGPTRLMSPRMTLNSAGN